MARKNTPTQEQAIRNMMVGRKLQLRNPGPRSFPKYKPGMGVREYVRLYRFANINHACFHEGDICFLQPTTQGV
jgi:hypothetical protein